MDPLTIGAVTGLAFLSEKVAEKVLAKLVGDDIDKTWAGREKLADIFRKYAYDEVLTLDLSEEYKPDKKSVRGERDKLSIFLRRNEDALREIADLLGESLMPQFSEFSKYREMETYRAKLKEKFAAETDDLKQLRISTEIETATGQIEQLKKTILDFAETITKIPNPSEKQIEARKLFFAGKLEEARILLEDSREEMQDIKARALAVKEKKEVEFAGVNEKLEQIAKDYLLLAQTAATNFHNPNRFEDAQRYFEESIECQVLPENLFAYAQFLQDHKLYQPAISLYEQIDEEFRNQISESEYASALHNLGVLHAHTQELATAEKEFEEALAIYQRLARVHPLTYEPNVASILNNLGALHARTQEFATAGQEYTEALVIYQRLAETSEEETITFQKTQKMRPAQQGSKYRNIFSSKNYLSHEIVLAGGRLMVIAALTYTLNVFTPVFDINFSSTPLWILLAIYLILEILSFGFNVENFHSIKEHSNSQERFE